MMRRRCTKLLRKSRLRSVTIHPKYIGDFTRFLFHTKGGDFSVFDKLVKNGADLNYVDKSTGQTPLMRCVLIGFDECVAKLLAMGADTTIGVTELVFVFTMKLISPNPSKPSSNTSFRNDTRLKKSKAFLTGQEIDNEAGRDHTNLHIICANLSQYDVADYHLVRCHEGSS